MTMAAWLVVAPASRAPRTTYKMTERRGNSFRQQRTRRPASSSPQENGGAPAQRMNITDEMLRQRMGSYGPTRQAKDGDPDVANEVLLNQSIRGRQGGTGHVSVGPKIKRAPRTETTQQHFGGALTTLVFGAALLSERLNGVGIVQNLELHNKGFHPVLLFSIAVLLCASAWPEKREWGNPGLLARIQMAGARVAYLGLAAAIAAEMVTGIGVLSLMDIETGVEAFSDVEAVMIFLTMLVLTGPQSREIK